MFTDCSTMTIVTPSALSRSTTSMSASTTTGASPSDSSSMSRSFGLEKQGLGEGQHLLLAAGQRPGRLVELRRRAPGTARARRRSARRCGARSHLNVCAPARRFSATVSPGNTALPPGICTMPSAIRSWAASRSIDSPRKATVPGRLRRQAGDDPQQRRLPGAVGAEQGEDLPGVDGEVDAEQHLDVPVGEVDAARRRGGAARRPSRRSRAEVALGSIAAAVVVPAHAGHLIGQVELAGAEAPSPIARHGMLPAAGLPG